MRVQRNTRVFVASALAFCFSHGEVVVPQSVRGGRPRWEG